MNLRMFPVYSNSPRRLRRVITPTIASYAAQERQLQSSANQEVLNSKNRFQSSSTSAADDVLVYLNQADRETLLRQQAIDKAQQGQYLDAIDLFTLLIQYNPNSASNYNNRGLLHFQSGQLNKALIDYDRALRLNPRLAKVYNNRANCYAALGELEFAIADYETAIDLDPTDIRARLNQGITFRELELYHEAIESFDLALQFSQFLNTTDTVGVPTALEGHIYAERGRTYHILGDWNCAVADYHRALARLPITYSDREVSYRLRSLVKSWLDDLLSPQQAS
ncbi:MAG: tetratricopeptide repeat protein [Leptolyngbyaceae cyanobacterium RU_5_1]|nr:tetratricopeptide repeat protein [Leptolyngbyaceae cyanobacterium RU_5_1]